MRSIAFRPLRRVKKTGKIVVASYTQWRTVKAADTQEFSLTIDNEYKDMPEDEYVYNHKGELLHYYTYHPDSIKITNYIPILDIEHVLQHGIKDNAVSFDGGKTIYNQKGMDVEGVPYFAYMTADYIGTSRLDVSEFEPLTVKTVRMWFGWFLYQLDNLYLKIGIDT